MVEETDPKRRAWPLVIKKSSFCFSVSQFFFFLFFYLLSGFYVGQKFHGILSRSLSLLMTSLKNGQNGQTCVWIIIIVIVIVVLIVIIVSSITLPLSFSLFSGVQTSSLLCSCCRAASTLMLRPFFLLLLRALLGGQLLLTRLTLAPHPTLHIRQPAGSSGNDLSCCW